MIHTHDHEGVPLFERIASFENLHLAARRAAKGKRYRPPVAQFLLRMESECLRLHEELMAGAWYPQGYHVFEIAVPKRRTICAAPFRDRVVHQAMVQVVEPIFERSFIFDSYSCRKGKGTHAALQRVEKWAREYEWVAKVDVQKFFASVDHQVAMQLLQKKLGCQRTLDLFVRVLDSWSSDEAPMCWFAGDELLTPLLRTRGLPIGNLTSQFLSNVVLDAVDHRVKDGCGVRAFARYCDDMVIFERDPVVLWRVVSVVRQALLRLRLRAHPGKTMVHPVQQGVRFVGFVVGRNATRLPARTVAGVRRRLRALASVAAGDGRRRSVLAATVGHLAWGASPRWRQAFACSL